MALSSRSTSATSAAAPVPTAGIAFGDGEVAKMAAGGLLVLLPVHPPATSTAGTSKAARSTFGDAASTRLCIIKRLPRGFRLGATRHRQCAPGAAGLVRLVVVAEDVGLTGLVRVAEVGVLTGLVGRTELV